jgi:hypothetical protein
MSDRAFYTKNCSVCLTCFKYEVLHRPDDPGAYYEYTVACKCGEIPAVCAKCIDTFCRQLEARQCGNCHEYLPLPATHKLTFRDLFCGSLNICIDTFTGHRHGLTEERWPHGGLQRREYWKVMYPDGSSVRHGPYELYHYNGQLKLTCNYVVGIVNGLMIQYNYDGKMINSVEFIDGAPLCAVSYV